MHGERNAGGGKPPPLDLNTHETISALRVVNTLHDLAKELGDGLLARVWRPHAEELRGMCLAADRLVDALDLRRLEDGPTGAGFAITCESCGGQADGIDENGTARCACCEGGES
jgi:hypothetical protein